MFGVLDPKILEKIVNENKFYRHKDVHLDINRIGGLDKNGIKQARGGYITDRDLHLYEFSYDKKEWRKYAKSR